MPVNVTILGAGDAFASKGRFQAGYVISAGGTQILMDAGPTLLASMKRVGIAPGDIDVVLVSHLHGDHFCGLPFLILEYMYETPLRRKLTLAGPPNLEERTWALFRTMYPESDTSEIARQFDFVELEPGRTQSVAGLPIRSIRTPHTVKDISLAFRVEVGGKAIVFSGDTGWTDQLIDLSAGYGPVSVRVYVLRPAGTGLPYQLCAIHHPAPSFQHAPPGAYPSRTRGA